MPCYIKHLKFAICLFWLLGSLAVTAFADGISINKAEARLTEEGYQLKADFNINLNASVQQALSHGVAIYFVSEFSLTRSRWYWFDEQIAESEQITKLYYNVLTRQYRISHGTLFQSFQTLEEALGVLERQSSLPIAPELLTKKGAYLAGARLRLDIDQLPKLLQVNALTGKDWDLDSAWYRWVISPADIAARQQKTGEAAR
ncbi:MAG: DUF4390 domain-containing protein [Gallionella sp.]|nr:DUF4390 domain-containing protein [Gallionella sp.]